MKLTKKQREEIYNKYDGKCTYCGEQLEKGWHADHFHPVRRAEKWTYDENKNRKVTKYMENPENDVFENMVPACPSCNKMKDVQDIEGFRRTITNFVDSLNKYSVQYKFAKKYSLVEETNNKVVFYFETLAQ